MFLGCTSCHPLSFASMEHTSSCNSILLSGFLQCLLSFLTLNDGGIMSPMWLARACMSMLIPLSRGGGGGSLLAIGRSVTKKGCASNSFTQYSFLTFHPHSRAKLTNARTNIFQYAVSSSGVSILWKYATSSDGDIVWC